MLCDSLWALGGQILIGRKFGCCYRHGICNQNFRLWAGPAGASPGQGTENMDIFCTFSSSPHRSLLQTRSELLAAVTFLRGLFVLLVWKPQAEASEKIFDIRIRIRVY